MSESTDMPLVVCLCPTYGRPARLLANTIQCFLDQDYPQESRMLVILDDLGNVSLDYKSLNPLGVNIVNTPDRFTSLPSKYNFLRRSVTADIQIVWEDDELYIPHHISSYVESLKSHQWAHPEHVLSTYTGTPQIEKSGGRFHAALGFRTEFLNSIGGWPVTDEPNFDQQLIALATRHASPGRPDHGEHGPSYVFRWADTGATHGQGTMDKGVDWYRVAKPQYTERVHLTLEDIRYDEAAAKTIAAIISRQSGSQAVDS
jgi:hypothetical protein